VDIFTLGIAPDYRVIDGVVYALPLLHSDGLNPFVVATYDYDGGFYRGTFTYVNPITGQLAVGTPEEYGRARIVAALAGTPLRGLDVLDLGAGNLNILRELALTTGDLPRSFTNVDISGPWSPHRPSSLETGTRRFLEQSGGRTQILNVQYDFNQEVWPFGDEVADLIVSSMACHHVRPARKGPFMNNVYRSLRPGGFFMVMDFFKPSGASATCLTYEGGGGPRECAGYGEIVGDYMSRAAAAGFILDDVTATVLKNGTPLTARDFRAAQLDWHLGCAVSPATWHLVMEKPSA